MAINGSSDISTSYAAVGAADPIALTRIYWTIALLHNFQVKAASFNFLFFESN